MFRSSDSNRSFLWAAAAVATLSGLGAACEGPPPLTSEAAIAILDAKHKHDLTVDLALQGTLQRAATDKPGRSDTEKAKVTYECLQNGGFGTYTVGADEVLENGTRNTFTFVPSPTLLESKVGEATADRVTLKACTAQVAEITTMKELTRDTQKVAATMGHTDPAAWLECLAAEGGQSLLSLEIRNICLDAGKPAEVKSTLVNGPDGWAAMKGQ